MVELDSGQVAQQRTNSTVDQIQDKQYSRIRFGTSSTVELYLEQVAW